MSSRKRGVRTTEQNTPRNRSPHMSSDRRRRSRPEERHNDRKSATNKNSGSSLQASRASFVSHETTKRHSNNKGRETRGLHEENSTSKRSLLHNKTSLGTSNPRSSQSRIPTRNVGKQSSKKQKETGYRKTSTRPASSTHAPSKIKKDVKNSKQNETIRERRRRSKSREKHGMKNSVKDSRKRRSSSSISTHQPKKKPRKEMNPFLRYDNRLSRLLSKDPSEIIVALLDDYQAFGDFLKCDNMSAKSVEEILQILSKLYDTQYTQNFAKIFAAFQGTEFVTKHVRDFIFRISVSAVSKQDSPQQKTHLERIIRFFHEFLNRFPDACEDLPLDPLYTYSAQWQTTNNNDSINNNEDESENKSVITEITDHNGAHPNTDNSPTDKDSGKQIKDSILKLISLRNEILRQRHSPSCISVVQNPPDDYKSIPVFPRREDIFPDKPPFLRKNIVGSRYSDVTHYLDVQFRLLREDYIAPIRDGVLEATAVQDDRSHSIHVYRDVQVVGRILDTKSGGLLHRVSFDVSRMRKVNWEHSKRFKYGSLYCLIDSETIGNKTQTTMYFVTIADRNAKDLRKGFLNVKLFDDNLAEPIPLEKRFFMIESPAYFESYRHVLEGLQSFSKDSLPFQRYLVECNSEVRPPVYLLKSTNTNNENLGFNEVVASDQELKDLKTSFGTVVRDDSNKRANGCYNLTKALECKTAKSVSILDPCAWPSLSQVDLNRSQFNALKAALTQEFVVIQGPPGTGKTFVGLRIANALLANKSIWRRWKPLTEDGVEKHSENHSPILVVCYTNHALDQFLEGISQITDNITRVGGRGKSECIQRFNLKERKKLTKESLCWHRLKGELKDVQCEIEEERSVIVAANKELVHSDVESFLNDEESEQLEQWERVANQMRVHRIDAWLQVQDELDGGDGRETKRKRSSTTSSEIEETHGRKSKRLRNTAADGSNQNHDQSQTLQTKIEKHANEKTSSKFQKHISERNLAPLCPAVENTKGNDGNISELEEGELPDSDDDDVFRDVTKMDDNDNVNLSEVDNLRQVLLRRQQTFGHNLSIKCQELPLNLIQYPTPIKNNINEEDNEDNVMVSDKQCNYETDRRTGNYFSSSRNSGKRDDEEENVMVIEKHSNDERAKEMNNVSTMSLLATNSGKANDNVHSEMLGDQNVNERCEKSLSGKDYGKQNKDTSAEDGDCEEGEILDPNNDLTDSDEESEDDDEKSGRVIIDLTTVFEPKSLLEGSKSTGKYANGENKTKTTEFNSEKNIKESVEQKPSVVHEITPSEQDSQNENNEQRYQVKLKELSKEQRANLYQEWVARFSDYHGKTIERLQKEHNEILQQLAEIDNIQVEGILKKVDVIGMTTTGAAKHRRILQEIKPRIVIVEEAAEVLEGHVITSLSSGTDHLILIGDHKQLKPNPTVYELARKYKLDVSLFERMVANGLTCHSLDTQHRMRPEIADIMRIIYPTLVDSASVKHYDSVLGIQRNVYFIDHEQPESGNEELKSHSNEHEVAFVAALCRYLLLQGYQGDRITVLTMYTGQLLKLQRHMPKTSFDGIRISSVDNFQGEESDIIILSLVRSNQNGNIGFLNVPNRVCVALSRAKKAMYCIGNISMMAKKNKLWNKIKNRLEQKSLIGKSLPLCCPNHPLKEIQASSADDFKNAPKGGCLSPCEFRLSCGHVCPLHCHPVDKEHAKYRCTKQCLEELCDLKHLCQRRCHLKEDCGSCKKMVPFVIPSCKHKIRIECWQRSEVISCPTDCTKDLPCGHRCAGKCGQDCKSIPCRVAVTRTLRCGHDVSMRCSDDVVSFKCRKPCEKLLECGHNCPGDCSQCFEGTFHVQCNKPCKRLLVCSHECTEPCTSNCPPCKKRCKNRCQHSACHRICSAPCAPCRERCMWRCKHYKCTKRCGEMCDRTKCNEPCGLKLKCGHRCAGVCGEYCPRLCRVCHKDKIQTIFLGREDEPNALYMELVDCGHVFEVNDLDYWMEGMEEDENVSIQFKVCPKCKTPIRRSFRYGNIIKKTLDDIETVKKIKLDEQKRLLDKRIQLRKRILDMKKTNAKLVNSLLLFRCDVLRPDAYEHNTLASELQFLSCLGEIDDMFFEGPENEDFVARSSKLVSAKERICQILYNRRLLTNQEVDDISENITFLSLSCRFQRMILQMEQNIDSCALSEEIKSNIESAKEIMSRQVNAIGTSLAVTDVERAVVASVIETMNSILAIKSLTPKEHAGILEAFKFSKSGHWYKCRNGHVYVITECGGAMERSKCPECREVIGGGGHKLAEGNQLAPEMDGARHSAWSDQANLLNYDQEELRRLQR